MVTGTLLEGDAVPVIVLHKARGADTLLRAGERGGGGWSVHVVTSDGWTGVTVVQHSPLRLITDRSRLGGHLCQLLTGCRLTAPPSSQTGADLASLRSVVLGAGRVERVPQGTGTGRDRNTVSRVGQCLTLWTGAALHTLGGAVGGGGDGGAGVGTAVGTLPVLLTCWAVEATLPHLQPPGHWDASLYTEVTVTGQDRTQAVGVGVLTGADIKQTVLICSLRVDLRVTGAEGLAPEDGTPLLGLPPVGAAHVTRVTQVLLSGRTILLLLPAEKFNDRYYKDLLETH